MPVRATFDPVGSTATLVVERFRQNGMEPSKPAAAMLLAAVLSDTVLLNSPTATDRDRVVVEFLEKALSVDAMEFGGEMFEAGSDVTGVSAADIVGRDAKEYALAGGETIAIAQIEVVGKGLLERADELSKALEELRERNGHVLAALMVTDILSKGTDLLVPATPARSSAPSGSPWRTGPAAAGRDEPEEAGRPEAPGRVYVLAEEVRVDGALLVAADIDGGIAERRRTAEVDEGGAVEHNVRRVLKRDDPSVGAAGLRLNLRSRQWNWSRSSVQTVEPPDVPVLTTSPSDVDLRGRPP